MARIAAWGPLQDIFSTRREIDRIFDNFFHNQSVPRSEADDAWSPSVDVVDTQDHVEFHAEIPGMSEDDVKVSITENVLTVSGEKKPSRRTRRTAVTSQSEATGSSSVRLRFPATS